MRVNISGLRVARNKFRKLKTGVQKKVARKSLRAGAKIVLAAARQLAPVDTGALKKSIKIQSVRSRKRDVITFDVVAKWAFTGRGKSKVRRPYYAHAMEYGVTSRGMVGHHMLERGERMNRGASTNAAFRMFEQLVRATP